MNSIKEKDYNFRKLNRDFELILWLKKRIKYLKEGIGAKRKTDSITDFELLSRKLKVYQEEYDFRVNEIHLLLKTDEKILL